MVHCTHSKYWETAIDPNPILTGEWVKVRCAECHIETNFRKELIDTGLITGAVVRKSWGQDPNWSQEDAGKNE